MSEQAVPENAVESASKIETSADGVVKRWIAELDIADGAESKFRKTGAEVWGKYKAETPQANSFAILWSNTETLRPAVYNSPPKPDVRRRFHDPDPVGKVASKALERGLSYSIDDYDFDHEIQQAVLDLLLPGRGLVRVKYVPTFDSNDAVTYEQVTCEHVQWDKFRRGPGKSWNEVQWVSFEYDFTKDQLVDMFGEEKAALVKLTDVEDDSKASAEVRALLQTGKVFEIWDKVGKRVLFISKGVNEPLKEEKDPLRLKQFFPIPRPLYAIEDTTTLVPRPLYKMYEIQALELNRVTRRIDKIVNALKVRGAYSSAIPEVKKIIEADDQEMIPVQNTSAVASEGGLDKAIWIMPIEKLAAVLESLYVAREKTIQAIYEITGLGDVMRGVSNPHETLGAQKIKSQWGTLRLQRLQREVQRFIRDLMRLKAEIIAEHFEPKQLATMSGIMLPTAEQKAQVQQMMQAQAGQAQQGGQPPPPMPDEMQQFMKLPTWDDVMKLLKSDAMRQYRIGIETDSTVEETVDRDMQGMQESMTAVVNALTGLGPFVQQGFMSVEVAKELCLAIARTSKAGQAVEDAIEQMKQPPPAPPPPDTAVEVANIKKQSAAEVVQLKGQMDAQKTASDAQVELQRTQMIESAKRETASVLAAIQLQTAQMQAQVQAQSAEHAENMKRMTIAHQESMKTEREAMITKMQEEAQNQRTQLIESVKLLIAEKQANVQRENNEMNVDQKREAAEAATDQKDRQLQKAA